MVTAFLDALGVSHDKGEIGSFEEVDASDDVLRPAVTGLVQEFGPRCVAVYLLALCLFRAPAGEKGRRCLVTLLKESSGDGPGEPEKPPPSEVVAVEVRGEQIQVEQEDPTRQPSFTTLDRLLIFTLRSIRPRGSRGPFPRTSSTTWSTNWSRLNGRRHQSYFHAGFRDVLFGKPVADELPAENQSRRRWYWTGAVQGWARRERWDCIVREHGNNPVVRELGSGSSAASVAAVRHIVEALRHEGRTAEIPGFVKVRALVGQPRLFRLLLEAATDLLANGDAASALPIFERLMETRRELERTGVSPRERLLLDAHRRMAHCLRQLHQHTRARGLLMDLLKQDPDPNIHAMVHADLGLMVGGFDGLEDIVLPLRRDELDGVVDRLAKGVEHFRKSVDTRTGYSAHGHHCLGVLALGRAVTDHTFEDAEHHLQRARVHFSESPDDYPSGLVEHANLYFGIAKALQLSSHKLAHAADVISDSLASGARMPTYLIEQTIEAFGLAEEKRDLRQVTEALLHTGGEQALDELANCEVALNHCSSVAGKLAARAHMDGRAAADRAADLRTALHGFRKHGDWSAAGDALDRLERLARDDVGVPEFLALLEEQEYYDGAWDLEDTIVARARCHEDRGEFLEAATVLRELFYRLASPEREAGLSDAAGVLNRISGYGIDPDYYSAMTSRHDALAAREREAGTPVEPGPGSPVRVLVVGGGEKQARAEDAVVGKLKEQHPRIRVHLIQTGWSGNWSRTLAQIESQMESHDALVIIRFMRTHLDREIRRSWDGPWRSCWSGGSGAIVEAVVEVAEATERSR